MCRFASFKFKPAGHVAVRVAADLSSHRDIPGEDGARPNGWREGHYLPTGEIECRTLDVDRLTGGDCEEILRDRWPTFVDFFACALTTTKQAKMWPGCLDLSGLTSIPAGLKLPETVGGWLYLRGLTSIPAGLKLPETVGGWLALDGLTSIPAGLKLPETVGGGLYLSGLTSIPAGLKLPETVGGWLDLSGLTSIPAGLKLPETVGGWLALGGLRRIPAGLKLPETVGRGLYLAGRSITLAKARREQNEDTQ